MVEEFIPQSNIHAKQMQPGSGIGPSRIKENV